MQLVKTMKTTLNLPDDLVAQAMKDTGINEKTKLIQYALKEVVSTAARKRLAAMYGTGKGSTLAPRKRISEANARTRR